MLLSHELDFRHDGEGQKTFQEPTVNDLQWVKHRSSLRCEPTTDDLIVSQCHARYGEHWQTEATGETRIYLWVKNQHKCMDLSQFKVYCKQQGYNWQREINSIVRVDL